MNIKISPFLRLIFSSIDFVLISGHLVSVNIPRFVFHSVLSF